MGRCAARDAGWPNTRTILTYHSFDAYRTRNTPELPSAPGRLMGNHNVTVNTYPGEPPFELSGPYAGVLGWPAQCASGDRRCWPDADKDNLVEVMKGAREYGVHFKGGQDLLKAADKAVEKREKDREKAEQKAQDEARKAEAAAAKAAAGTPQRTEKKSGACAIL